MRTEQLSYDTIARSAGESVAPELWPDHAWVPALGVSGQTLPNPCNPAGVGTPYAATFEWETQGLFIDGDDTAATYDHCPTTSNFSLANSPFCFYQRLRSTRWDTAATHWRGAGYTYYQGTNRRAMLVAPAVDFNGGTARRVTFYISSDGTSTAGKMLGTSLPELGANRWYHVFGQWTGSQIEIAAIADDGTILRNQAAWTTGIYAAASPPPLVFGSYGTAAFNGTMSHGYVFKHALTHGEQLTLSADPLLPFRRRRSVRYFISSTVGGIAAHYLHYQKMRAAS